MNSLLPTGTVTFLFTDIVGSTPLWERQPEKMAAALQIHHAALRGAIEGQDGVVFKTVGDAFQAAFSTAPQALRAAIEGQHALQTAPWNELGELKVRMGLHTGEAELDPGGDEYAVSHAKNRAARIMSVAHGGQVLLSQETKDLVDHQLPEGVSLKDLGEHRLKGMQWPEHLYQLDGLSLVTEFPALNTAIVYPNNLPLQLTSLVGRQQEVRAVCDLLSTHRQVTLTGSGGTGKTRLSLCVAEEQLPSFTHGVWFTELASLADPELVPRALVSTLGLLEDPKRSLLEQLIGYLRDKQILIILDNCEHVIADCARITESLLRACPAVKILASSREALGVPGETAYHVPSLAVPDSNRLPSLEETVRFSAVRLFVERAALVNPDFSINAENFRAVVQICRRLDGIPLAIELAAARTGSLGIEQIAARLDNRFRLLTGGSRTAVARQQTLRASIDWSYSLLELRERLLLMRLAVFHGGWTFELANEVCAFEGLDEYDILDGLDQLVNKSLIYTLQEAGGIIRYRRLETIRQYGLEKLMDSGSSEIVYDRHLATFLGFVLRCEPHLRGHQQVKILDQLELELDNLRAALEWSLEGQPESGLRLATSLYWFWHIRGYQLEGERWIDRLLELVRLDPQADRSLLAEAMGRQALLWCLSAQVGEHTETLAMEALARAKELGDAGLRYQFYALHAIAWNASFLYDSQASYEVFLQCMQVAQAAGDRFLIAEAAQNLCGNELDLDKSREYAQINLTLRQEFGDLDGLMTAQSMIGHLSFRTGDLDQARLHYEQAIQMAKEIKNRYSLITFYGEIGRVFYLQDELDKSIQYFSTALELVQDIGEQIWISWLCNALIYAYGAQKDWFAVETYFVKGLQVLQAAQSTYFTALLHLSLAEVAWSCGKIELSRQHYRRVVEYDQADPAFRSGWRVAYCTGRAAWLRDEFTRAERYLRQAIFAAADENPDCIGNLLESLAACVLQNGQFGQAARLHGMIKSRWWLRDPVMPYWFISHDLDTLLAPARSALGKAEYDRQYAAGLSMTLEQIQASVGESPDPE